jgi:hypothetical protein
MKRPYRLMHCLVPITDDIARVARINSITRTSNRLAAIATFDANSPGGNRASCMDPSNEKSPKNAVIVASAVTVPNTWMEDVSSNSRVMRTNVAGASNFLLSRTCLHYLRLGWRSSSMRVLIPVSMHKSRPAASREPKYS